MLNMSKVTGARRIIYTYESKLVQDVILKRRYKRFLADVSSVISACFFLVILCNILCNM